MTEYSPKTFWPNLYREGLKKGAPALNLVCVPGLPRLANRVMDRVHARVYTKLLSLAGTNRGPALDMGCGAGRWLLRLAKKGFAVTGLEYAREALLHNKERPGLSAIPMVQASAHETCFKDESFDLVSVVTVIQHLPYPDQEKALDEIIRVLRPGGHAVVIEHITPKDLPGREMDWQGVYPRSMAEWVQGFEARGLVSVKHTRLQYFPLFDLYKRAREALLRVYQALRGGPRGTEKGNSGPMSGPNARTIKPPVVKRMLKACVKGADSVLVSLCFSGLLPFEALLGRVRGSHAGFLLKKPRP
jgi:SAM-dependent methyltransferase